MCDCILELVEREFVRTLIEYKDYDFKTVGFAIYKHKHSLTQKDAIFEINYCPACGRRTKLGGEQ